MKSTRPTECFMCQMANARLLSQHKESQFQSSSEIRTAFRLSKPKCNLTYCPNYVDPSRPTVEQPSEITNQPNDQSDIFRNSNGPSTGLKQDLSTAVTQSSLFA